MASPSKRKGSAFENEIAKFLNEAHNTTEFARVPLSGAFMGRNNADKRKGIEQSAQSTLRGDIITPRDFPYVIECKCRDAQPLLNKVLDGNDISLNQWIEECKFDADHENKLPMVVFKVPRKGTYFVIPSIDTEQPHMRYNHYIIFSKDYYQSIVSF